jgi:gluconolactonase
MLFKGLLVLSLFSLTNCTSTSEPKAEWTKKNDELIAEHKLTVRELSGLPKNSIESNIEAAKVKSLDNIDSVTLYPGITAKIFWGTGNMVAIVQLAPNAQIPEEKLTADRLVFVMEGSINQSINGATVAMSGQKREVPDGNHSGTPRTDFVYIEKGSKNSVTAGAAGAKLLEVYSPLRLDYLQKAGIKNRPDEVADVEATQTPNVTPNKVYDLYDIQLTKIAEGAHTRLVSGKNMQLSFISMDPNSTFPHHIHPEEQMMFVFRGECNEIILDGEQAMKANSVVRLPSNMVHGAKIGDLGCDALDIFWPARPDYLEKQKAALAAYHAIIPEDAKLELLVDGKKTQPGLTFSEGHKWMNGKF